MVSFEMLPKNKWQVFCGHIVCHFQINTFFFRLDLKKQNTSFPIISYFHINLKYIKIDKQVKNSREGRCVTRMFRGPILVDYGWLAIGYRPCADLITDLAVVTL